MDDTYTDDGLMSVSYPSIGLAGLPSRSAEGGGVQYIAGLPAGDRYESVLVVLNPYPRDFEIAVRLYRADGGFCAASRGQSAAHRAAGDARRVYPRGPRVARLQSQGIGTVVTETALTRWCSTRSFATGTPGAVPAWIIC